MDPGARTSTPWRYRVWGPAWLIALLAYVPVDLLAALITSYFPFQPMWVENVVLFGPLSVLGILMMACIIRGIMGPEVPLIIDTDSPSPESVRRSVFWTRIIGTVCTLVFIVGQIWRHFL
jgi:hypothetical protein